MSTSPPSTPEGPGSVSGAPNLPGGFAETFTSRHVDTGELRLHAVIGGEGPPLLLVHGWPETWYAWRLLMPALAQDFEVIAVDQRGMGLSEKPAGGYDTRSQAADLVALMDALGHEQFAVVGHDTGFAISYALAADHPNRVAYVALAEIPGSPGTITAPPLFLPGPLNDRLWHLGFNRIDKLNEQLVTGREGIFYRWEFDAAAKPLPDDVIDYYVSLLSNPDSLRGSFGWYRALDTTIAQDEQRKTRRLTMPVLAIGGEASFGEHVLDAVQVVADDVHSVVIPGTGHFVAEEAPEEMIAALTAFLAPYRDASNAASTPQPAAAAASGSLRQATMCVPTSEQTTRATAIRPFTVEVPQAEIDVLRARLAATRWPDMETVDDRSQGVQLAKLRPLVEYWGAGYDWRKVEATLNALPQFITEIDGLDIQFAHIRSPHDGALPLLMTHGWPGSIIELLKVIEPLTNPTAHGGRAEDAFHLVLPTLPGYGFSGNPTSTGWNPARVAIAFDELMLRVGYQRYVAQGGDWGAIISELLAVRAPKGLLGIHVNMPGTVPPDVLRHLRNNDPAPAQLSDPEKIAYDRLLHFYHDGFGYAAMMNQSPQTIGYALADSPVAMAAFYYDKFAEWTDSGGEPEKVFTDDEMLDAISLYWLTNTGTSSSRSYWEGAQAGGGPFDAFDIPAVPVAVTVFPAEIYQAPRTWGEKAFGNLIYWNEVDAGGHFAAWEQPELFTAEVRAAFRSLR